jgi:hypothetical protein
MKSRTLACIFLLLIVVFVSDVYARKGIGVKWSTESASVDENSRFCIEYGLYNPWDEGINIVLGVSDEFKDVVTNIETEPVYVEPNTTQEKAVPVNVCFEVGDVYKDDCLIFGMMCKQECGENVMYEGNILATEYKEQGETEAMGSSTSLSFSVPLKLSVNCNERGRDWTLAYLVGIIVVLILIGVIVYRIIKSKKEEHLGSLDNEI